MLKTTINFISDKLKASARCIKGNIATEINSRLEDLGEPIELSEDRIKKLLSEKSYKLTKVSSAEAKNRWSSEWFKPIELEIELIVPEHSEIEKAIQLLNSEQEQREAAVDQEVDSILLKANLGLIEAGDVELILEKFKNSSDW